MTNDSVREEIINKRDALLRERRHIREQRQSLMTRDRLIDRELADCRAAARLFELNDIEFPLDEREEFLRIREIEHRLMHKAAAGPLVKEEIQAVLPLSAKKITKIDAASILQAPRIKDIILHLLKQVGPTGIKANAIKQYIESTYGKRIHYKTVGMTLYRLSQEKEKPVCREGQVWFLSASVPEKRNLDTSNAPPAKKRGLEANDANV